MAHPAGETITTRNCLPAPPNRWLSVLALGLLVPVPSIGTAAAMLIDATEGPIGQGLYGAAKVWMVALPVFWLLVVQRGRVSFSPARHGGFLVAGALGAAIAAAILGTYWVAGPSLIDATMVQDQARESGIDHWLAYLGFAVYLCAVNSLLEEYVWRWFVFRQCETFVGGRIAVVLSALFFTLHHVLALSAQFDWPVTVLGSIGVFIGGGVWSWCYLRYRSIWPGYVSHLVVDVVILIIGWDLIFRF